MKFQFEEGEVQDLAPADKKGARTCHVNGRQISFHPDISDSVAPGDRVLVAGVLRKTEFHGLAIKNFTQNKVSGIDCTNYILLMGLGFMLFIMFGVFYLQTNEVHVLYRNVDATVALAALAGSLFLLRRIYRASGAVNQIS